MKTQFLDGLNKIKSRQLTIDKLLERGSLVLKNSAGVSNAWVLEPLYQGKDCSVGFVEIKESNIGPCEPHAHNDSKEYLIVVKGSILLNVEGRDVRIVREGECSAIPASTSHYSRPLENDTKLVYVCVPTDEDMFKIPGLEIKK